MVRRGQPCTATPAGLRMISQHDEVTLLERTLATDLPWLSPRPATLRIAVAASCDDPWAWRPHHILTRPISATLLVLTLVLLVVVLTPSVSKKRVEVCGRD